MKSRHHFFPHSPCKALSFILFLNKIFLFENFYEKISVTSCSAQKRSHRSKRGKIILRCARHRLPKCTRQQKWRSPPSALLEVPTAPTLWLHKQCKCSAEGQSVKLYIRHRQNVDCSYAWSHQEPSEAWQERSGDKIHKCTLVWRRINTAAFLQY